MPYDEILAKRIQKSLSRRKNFTQKKMFGGCGFLLHGNICVGVWKDFLVVRLDPDAYTAALKERSVKPFDITGRPMAGWIMVEPAGVIGDLLQQWISLSAAYVATLPRKATKPNG